MIEIIIINTIAAWAVYWLFLRWANAGPIGGMRERVAVVLGGGGPGAVPKGGGGPGAVPK